MGAFGGRIEVEPVIVAREAAGSTFNPRPETPIVTTGGDPGSRRCES